MNEIIVDIVSESILMFRIYDEETKNNVTNDFFFIGISFIPKNNLFITHPIEISRVINILGKYYQFVEVLKND